MDPDAALATLRDADADRDERTDAGLALIAWIAGGGYIPRTVRSVPLVAIAQVVALIERTR